MQTIRGIYVQLFVTFFNKSYILDKTIKTNVDFQITMRKQKEQLIYFSWLIWHEIIFLMLHNRQIFGNILPFFLINSLKLLYIMHASLRVFVLFCFYSILPYFLFIAHFCTNLLKVTSQHEYSFVQMSAWNSIILWLAVCIVAFPF